MYTKELLINKWSYWLTQVVTVLAGNVRKEDHGGRGLRFRTLPACAVLLLRALWTPSVWSSSPDNKPTMLSRSLCSLRASLGPFSECANLTRSRGRCGQVGGRHHRDDSHWRASRTARPREGFRRSTLASFFLCVCGSFAKHLVDSCDHWRQENCCRGWGEDSSDRGVQYHGSECLVLRRGAGC